MEAPSRFVQRTLRNLFYPCATMRPACVNPSMRYRLLLLALLPLAAQAQRSQRITVWFDSTKTHPHEI